MKCGRRPHSNSEACPAESVTCSACSKAGHFARACIKTGNAILVTSSDRRRLHNIVGHESHYDNDDNSYGSSDDSVDDINTVKLAAVKNNNRIGKFAVLYAQLNGHRTRMLYDPGAAFSVIGSSTWRKIGSPSLSPAPDLMAYMKMPIVTLGFASIHVTAFRQNRKLDICVVEGEDTPLFGLDWVEAFHLPLPKGVQVCAIRTSTESATPPTTVTSPTAQQPSSGNQQLQQLLDEYSDIFQPGHGTIRGQEAVVNIDPSARPRAFPARAVPFPLRKAVEAELERLTTEGILEPVDPRITPIEWASPIVIAIKTNGAIRICGDFKVTINPHILPDRYPLPRFEEIAAKLNGCKLFSVIDLKDAHLQLPVAESSRKYLVIATHKGYFRYTRLAFGINFAPALFQSTMDKILAGIQRTAAYIDDVISGSATVEAHISRLRTVFDCFRKAGIRTQLSKCRFLQYSVTYLGHQIDAEGNHPTDERLAAIRDIQRPTNRKQLRSFLGAINYYAKFIPHLRSRCAPLHVLTRNDTQWHWNEKHDVIFNDLKRILTSDAILVHYDEDKPLVITTDASDVGIGAVLLHQFPDGTERPIAYASRVLSDAERRYATIDKEALAIVYAVHTKFTQYVTGRRFTLKTDHRPLERLFGAKTEIPKLAASRLARWAMTLSMYDYEIQYQTGSANAPADVLSRFPVDPPSNAVSEKMGERSNLLHLKLQDVSVSKKQLKLETTRDATLTQVIAFLERGWPPNTAELPPEMHTFFEKRQELSFEDGIVLWKGRIVVPKKLQATISNLLHEGHPGIVSMKELARFYVWWPCINKQIEEQVAQCSACQSGRARKPEVPLFSWSVTSEPWSRVHIDFAGPFEGFMWMIVIDSYTKWLEVIKMKSTTAVATCIRLREIFARLGLPRTVVSDNGPQFTSDEFQQFCQSNNIQAIRSSPYHPKTNGLAERAVRTFKERMTASRDVSDIDARLQKFLLSYRNAPQKSTGRPPSELMFGRRLRTRLDLLKPDVRSSIDKANFRQQLQHDKSATHRSFKGGDAVWVLNPSGSGYQPGEIHRRTGPLSYQVLTNGKTVRKHADQLRKRSRRATEVPEANADASDDSDATTLEVRSPSSPRQLEELLPSKAIPVRQPQLLHPTSPPEVEAVTQEKEASAGSTVQLKDQIEATVPPQVAEQVQDQGQAVQAVPIIRRSTRVRHAPRVLYNPV